MQPNSLSLSAIVIFFTFAWSATAFIDYETHPISFDYISRPNHPKCFYKYRRAFRDKKVEALLSINITSDRNSSKYLESLIIPRLEAAAILRENLMRVLGQVLLLPLDKESRVSYERIQEALLTRHISVYDILPIIPILYQRTLKEQLHAVLQILERIDSSFVSGYAGLCKDVLTAGRINLRHINMNILVGIDKSMFIIFDKNRKGTEPLVLKDAMALIMKGLSEERIRLNFKIVAAIIPHLKNFDMTNPEIPDAIKFVVDYMKYHAKSQDTLFDYIGENQSDDPSSLVRIVLERMEISKELTSPFVKESISLLLDNFDVTQRRPTWKDEATKIFNIVVPDFYPERIVKIAEYVKDKFSKTVSYIVDRTFYRKDTQILLEVLLRLNNEIVLPESIKGYLLALRSFVSRKVEEDTQKGSNTADYFYILKNFDSFRAPCMPERIMEAERRLRPLLPTLLPWSFAMTSGDPWQQTIKIMINLKSHSIPKKVDLELDNLIYHGQSSGLAGKQSILYENGIIFQRNDSSEVELDIYSLLLRIPNVFKDERYNPLISFMAKSNILDYLAPKLNKFAYEKPRDLLLALLKTAGGAAAVQQEQNLSKALSVAQSYLEQSILINMYTTRDLENILKSLPAIDNDPRLIPLKLLFREENLFKYMSPTFSLAGLKSPLEQIALILNTVNLKPVPQPLGESIKFALSIMEGNSLPWKSFAREDFIYLVNELMSRHKRTKIYLLEAAPYRSVSDWNLTVSGKPESILARVLSYPVEDISNDEKLARTVKKSITILEGEPWRHMKFLTRKMLDSMLEYLPDNADTRVVSLILKNSNLAVINPKFKISSLKDLDPKTALINVLQSLINSKHMETERLLVGKLEIVLNSVQMIEKLSNHGSIEIYLKKALTNPSNTKYTALYSELRSMTNGTYVLPLERESTLRTHLITIRDNSKTPELKEAAKLALTELSREQSHVLSVNLTLENSKFFTKQLINGSQANLNRDNIRQMLVYIPSNTAFNEIRQLIKSGRLFEVLPKNFEMEKFFSPKEKLVHILVTLQRELPPESSLSISVSSLRHHLLNEIQLFRELDVVQSRKTLLLGGLVLFKTMLALKRFLTSCNLYQYLPLGFNLASYATPYAAMVAICNILSAVPAVTTNVELYTQLLSFKLSLGIGPPEKHSDESYETRNTRKFLFQQRLNEEDFVFVKLLPIQSSELKQLFVPKLLVQVLPGYFNFATTRTFKSKVVHLVKALIKKRRSLRLVLQKFLYEVESYPNLWMAKDEELEPLVNVIPDSGMADLALLKRNLRVNKLSVTLPSYYRIKSHKTPKDNLKELLYFLYYSLDTDEVRLKTVAYAVWRELQNENSEIFNQYVNISLDDIRFLLLEFPFHKYKVFQVLKFLLNEHKILAMLPRNFALSEYKTKKACLLAILKIVITRPEAKAVVEGLKTAVNVIRAMPDTPKVNNTEIRILFSMAIQNKNHLKEVLSSCQTKNLFMYLPINFNLQALSSRKQRILALTRSCKLVKSNTVTVKKLLIEIEKTAKKLPNVDPTREQIEAIINEIPYTSFSSIKILLVHLAKFNIMEWLPWNLNLEIETTWKSKALALIKTMKTITFFKSNELMVALIDLEENVKRLPNKPNLTQELITSLQRLPVLLSSRGREIAKFLSLRLLLKIVPYSVNIEELEFDLTKLTIILNYVSKWNLVMNENVNRALRYVRHNLTKSAELEALQFLEYQVNQNESKYLPLKLHLMASQINFFAPLKDIPHGYEYQHTEVRVRVILKRLLSYPSIQKSKALVESMEALVFQLSTGPPADYDLEQALEELPNSEKYLDLRVLMKSSNYKKLFRELTLTQEHTPKRILLDMLKIVLKFEEDTSIQEIVKASIKSVQNSVWNFEFEMMFKELPNYAKLMSKLEGIRIYWMRLGPELILGEDYRRKYPKISERPKILYKRLKSTKEMEDNKELKASMDYLRVVLEDGEVIELKFVGQKSINDINTKTLIVALPKTRDEKIILGILRFFAIPNLLEKIKLDKSIMHYENKGSLLKAVLKSGLSLEIVKKDTRMQKSLEYFIDKIQLDGPGGRPIEFKKPRRDVKIDLVSLLKAVDPKAVNISMVVRIGIFFENEYDERVHAIGFDKTAYKTRGRYLRALLEHLIHYADVSNEVKDCAKYVYHAIKLTGSGAEPVDSIDEVEVENRAFGNDLDESQTTEKPANDLKTIFSHLEPESSDDLWAESVAPHVNSSSADSDPKTTQSNEGRKNKSENETKVASSGKEYNVLPVNATLKTNEAQPKRRKRQSGREVSSKNGDDDENSINRDMASATFHPDKILFDPKEITQNPSRSSPDVPKLMTFKEVESYKRKWAPVKPMRVRSDELPEPIEDIKVGPHSTNKDQRVVNLETRMMFVRPITMNENNENMTVKKDLSKSNNSRNRLNYQDTIKENEIESRSKRSLVLEMEGNKKV